jgi:hypothetical protein
MGLKRREKTMLGIAMSVITIVLIFVAMMGTTSARSNGGPYNIIDKQVAIQKVLRGQDLQFDNSDAWATWPVTVFRIVEGNIENTYTADFNNRIYDVNWPITGAYYVNYANPTTYDARLSIEDASIPLSLKVGTKTVQSIAAGSFLKINTGGLNLFYEDRVDLKVMGPEGQIKTDPINNQVFTNISVQTLTSTFGTTGINTANWKVGSYTFQIATKPENACGLDKNSGDPRSLTIIKGEIDISAEKAWVVQDAILKLTVTGVAFDNIQVAADPANENVEFQSGFDDTPNGPWCTVDKDCFTHIIDEDCKRTYAVKFLSTGFYTIKVTVTTGPNSGDYDTVTIAVVDEGVEMDVIQLNKNWNFISVPRELAEGSNTFEQVFGSVNTSGRSIFQLRKQ